MDERYAKTLMCAWCSGKALIFEQLGRFIDNEGQEEAMNRAHC